MRRRSFGAMAFAGMALVAAGAPDATSEAIEKLLAAGALVRPVAQGSAELAVDFAIQGQKAGDGELAPLKALPKVVERSGQRGVDPG